MKTTMTTTPLETLISKRFPRREASKPGDPFIMAVPVVSTAHITEQDGRTLCDCGDDDVGILAMICGGSGHILLTDGSEEDFMDYSETFRSLVSAFASLGYRYLRLDGDGEEIDGLSTFEW